MADSQCNTRMLSVRIVSIDYYMAPPIPGLDICYSSFHGGKVNEIPVVRIYGSTPAGQKTCLHMHRALPYLYVPCADIPLQPDQEGDAYTYKVSASLEKALKLKGSIGSTRQHVHGCSLAGAVFDKSLQPYESHIPFILQFLVDYNLYGMGHLHLSKMKFRLPIPGSSHKKLNLNSQQRVADPDGDACLESIIWTSSTISSDWMWQPQSELGVSSNHEAHCPKRQSTCELEGDASVDEILNRQFKMYSSLSQTRSDVQMVQSLIPIWKEQQERTGIYEATIPPDPGKPLPQHVLKNLSAGFDFEKKFLELCSEADASSSFLTPLEKELRETDIIGSASPPASLCKDTKLHEEGIDASLRSPRAADKEALNLLNWLASSQAAEDITSDDELIRETILSPLLPATTIDKVLEKANMDYESESQKECQDILDSIEMESSKQKLPLSSNLDGPIASLSNNMIPQVDGSGDDEFSSPCASSAGISFALDRKSETKGSSEYHVLQNTSTSALSKDNRDKVWRSLPSPKTHNNGEHASEKEYKGACDKIEDKCASDVREGHTLVNCSVRDLMRRKRCYRVEQADCESGIIKKLFLDKDEKHNTCLWKPQLDLKTPKTDEEKREVQKNCDLKMNNKDILARGKLPLVTGSDSFLQASMPEDEHFDQPEMDGLRAKAFSDKKFKVGPTYVQTAASDAYTQRFDPFFDVQKLTKNAEHEVRAPDNCQQINSEDLSSIQSSSVENVVSGNDCIYRCSNGQMTSYENSVDMNTASGVQVLQCVINKKKPGENLEFCETIGSVPIVHELVCNNMVSTVSRTPPMADVPERKMKRATLKQPPGWKDLDDFIPFSAGGSQKEMETWKNRARIGAPISQGELVAAHYQNDGTYLCILKPRILPPSVASVQRWLCCDERDHMFQETNAKEKNLPKCTTRPHLMSKLDQDVDSESKPPCMSGGQINGTKKCLDGAQDISQISGSDGKSRSTPLSQIGFRDPASIGCGQQLTLLSLEVPELELVLAESRGDLLPDPRFDSINIVALGFQNDSDTMIEVLVLLHNKLEPCQRSFDALLGCKVLVFTDEKELLKELIKIVSSSDPDILMGWDIQGGSLGYLAERASHLGLGLLNSLSRSPSESWIASEDTGTSEKDILEPAIPDISSAGDCVQETSIIEDEWGRTHASGVHVGGRIVLNVWRLIRGEVKLNLYSVEAVGEAVLRRKVPSIHCRVLTKWFSSGHARARYQCVKYITERARLNLEILSQLDMVNRTSELARIFGIDFFSVLSRGSQYRVESMFLRLAHTQNYLAISPGNQQVASQPAMECLPLVMEPESGFYSDPVVVLDFQSLYPSMIIAYNLCFCTCLGKVLASKTNTLGVSSFSPEQHVLQGLKDQILLTPNGVMFVPSKVRRGILPHLLEEILSTRIMVKGAMKKLAPSQHVLQRIFNARQLALKLISNVTYGYTAAGFSGRMPCAELADSIVQCGRRTLENAISFVNLHEKWNARVIYGDTDSMFVLLKGRTIKECLEIGSEIASAVTAMNPSPVTLKLEKVYHPCFLLTKKRYVGYSYESPTQIEPVFDAKGIETVRRDTCGAVSKIMEQSLRLYFEHQDLLEVKTYLQRQWKRILLGRVSLKDFVFAKEVRLGSYSRRISSLPPAAIVAIKAAKVDPRAEPRYGERVPYVVIHGEPGARLVDMVVDPLEVLAIDSPFRINDLYYINKQIIPALQRVFGLVGADLNQWFSEMPRPIKEACAKYPFAPNLHRTRIDFYYLWSKRCNILLLSLSNQCNSKALARQKSASIKIYLCIDEGLMAPTKNSRTANMRLHICSLFFILGTLQGQLLITDFGVKNIIIAYPFDSEREIIKTKTLALTEAAQRGVYIFCIVTSKLFVL
ncbi:DNA polymerase zeta catalytic subunit isoform X1 [Senna tora]|uniref:DNA polymerase n=1 Tax=Senna tora TaxID=362788 RepID=A0A834TB21_9FABA|nr:DNA polymerase zeta catalytic subunit isoform X1 [Senna tora]